MAKLVEPDPVADDPSVDPVADATPPAAEPALVPAPGAVRDANDPGPLVHCRWTSPMAVMIRGPEARRVNPDADVLIVRYGDPIWVTEEQLEDPNTPAVVWHDAWTPDPHVSALAGLTPQEA